MEIHPRIDSENPVLNEGRIILGSFPTWQFTSTKCEEEALEKEILIKNNKEFPFYYGSKRNNFWLWYQKYVDQKITPNEEISIRKSLSENRIGITDVIYSCKRSGRSALDKDLTHRVYNHDFLRIPKQNEVIKILCTSKGVMNEMLLNNLFLKKFPNLQFNEIKSNEFQANLMEEIGGDLSSIRTPFFKILETTDEGRIEIISIPSPGSPFRRLIDFGISDCNPQDYLQMYLKKAFIWFLK